MKKVRVGLDLDGVTAQYVQYLRKYVAKDFGVEEDSIPDPHSYSFYESGWGFESEEHFRAVHGRAVDEGMYAALEMYEGASEALWRLSDAGYHIRVITSRFVNHGQNATVVAQTAAWLDSNNIPYRDIVFTGHKTEIEADIYIDDSPSNIRAFEAAGKDVLIFDAPYNQSFVGPRAHNWDDVVKFIENNYPLTQD